MAGQFRTCSAIYIGHDSIFQKQPRSFGGWVAAISANFLKSRLYIRTICSYKTSPKMVILTSKLDIRWNQSYWLDMWCIYLVNLLGFILISEQTLNDPQWLYDRYECIQLPTQPNNAIWYPRSMIHVELLRCRDTLMCSMLWNSCSFWSQMRRPKLPDPPRYTTWSVQPLMPL